MNWKIVEQLASYQKDGKKAGLLQELADNFFQVLPDTMTNLKSTLDNKNYKILERVVHKLKGGSYIIGAQSLGDMFKVLELKIRDKDLNDIATLLSEIEQCSRSTEKKLADYIKEQQEV